MTAHICDTVACKADIEGLLDIYRVWFLCDAMNCCFNGMVCCLNALERLPGMSKYAHSFDADLKLRH